MQFFGGFVIPKQSNHAPKRRQCVPNMRQYVPIVCHFMPEHRRKFTRINPHAGVDKTCGWGCLRSHSRRERMASFWVRLGLFGFVFLASGLRLETLGLQR